jgi:hypothetical protein
MALTRRLFIGGLLASVAAPAIVTSKGFVPALRGHTHYIAHLDDYGYNLHGTTTGRMSFSEPEWQEFKAHSAEVFSREREMMKRITFGGRYGTRWTPGTIEHAESRLTRPRMVSLDFSDLEARVIAQRDMRDMFNALKLNS